MLCNPKEHSALLDAINEDRYCDVCGNAMIRGYVFDGGTLRMCSGRCLRKKFTKEEWDIESTDDSDSYFTEWY